MLVSFDISCIRQDQKQHRNGEACQASLTCFLVEPDKTGIKRPSLGSLFIMHQWNIVRHKKSQTNEKQTYLIILNIGTDRSEQTVQTQIRLLLMEQSDQGLLCLLFCLHLLNTILHCKIQLF